MPQVPLLSGIRADSNGRFRSRYPRNLRPVPIGQGISKGSLTPADGIAAFATGQGPDRESINWNGECYRVSGTKLIKVGATATVTVLGDVGGAEPARMDYSFDRLAVASGGQLFYWNGSTLVSVTDPDLGLVLDVVWLAGYFVTTDGTSIVVPDLTDPTSVNPLRYGSAESDPDPIKAVDEISEELFALNRYSIEPFQNVGGTGFPFQRIDSGLVARGVIGTHAYCKLLGTFCFLGSARDEPPSVYLMTPGDSVRVATSEIDRILKGYSEAQLSAVVVEARVDEGHNEVRIRLPDRCLVYDIGASKAVGESVWYTLDSGIVTPAAYRGANACWCYDKWIVGDPGGTGIGYLTENTMEHFGDVIGWDFGTLVIYNGGNDCNVLELELVGLPGRVDFGLDPVIWTSYSHSGEPGDFSDEKAIRCGKAGERGKRMAWRLQGRIRHQRMQQFRGTSDARVAFAALEATFEPLNTRPGGG